MRQANIFYKGQVAATLSRESDCRTTEKKYIKLLLKFEFVIKSSFLSTELKEKYGELLKERLGRLL
jgi:hypothetical protein